MKTKITIFGITELGIIMSGLTVQQDTTRRRFVYDSAIGNFVGWVGGTSVYKLDIDSGVWTKCTVDSANVKAPHPPQENGINGRWRYVPPPIDAFVTVQGVDKNVFFYKLSELKL